VKIGLWIIVIGFGGFILWASLAPLDEGVPCQGVVSIATKRKVVQRLMSAIKPGGHLLIGHSESLNGVCDDLQTVAPAVYRKP
jgi:protease secretion system membrane fusion protein